MDIRELEKIRGMHDIYGEKLELFSIVRDIMWELARCYGYVMIDTPILEYSKIFSRTLGDTSDIISKETYTFLDRDKHHLTMRPEFTASIVRAFITNGLTQTIPQKFFSYGPIFRHERPQKGRYRQFNQINCEFIGANGPDADLETILLIHTFIKKLGLLEHIKIEINTLGDYESRLLYKKALVEYFNDHKNLISQENMEKIEKNPLRILDTKIESDRKIVEQAPKITNFLNDISKNHYNSLLSSLDKIGISYLENRKIVRGLDYYTHTVFEFTTNLLGTQNTIVGGGRYDKLISMMGGPHTPAIGFACGMERLIELMICLKIEKKLIKKPITFFVIPIGKEAIDEAFIVTTSLRNNNFKTIIEYGEHLSVKKLFQKATQRYNADKVIIIGSEEIEKKQIKLKDMISGIEKIIPRISLIDHLTQITKENM